MPHTNFTKNDKCLHFSLVLSLGTKLCVWAKVIQTQAKPIHLQYCGPPQVSQYLHLFLHIFHNFPLLHCVQTPMHNKSQNMVFISFHSSWIWGTEVSSPVRNSPKSCCGSRMFLYLFTMFSFCHVYIHQLKSENCFVQFDFSFGICYGLSHLPVSGLYTHPPKSQHGVYQLEFGGGWAMLFLQPCRDNIVDIHV